jgi:hypothetical protein
MPLATGVHTSSDGISWPLTPLPGNFTRRVYFADNRFIMLSNTGTPSSVFSSSDGVTWGDAGTLPFPAASREAAYGNGVHVISDDQRGVVLTENFTTTAHFAFQPNDTVTGLDVSDGGVFACTRGGTLLTGPVTPQGYRPLGALGFTRVLRKGATIVGLTGTPRFFVSTNGGQTFAEQQLPVRGAGASGIPAPLDGVVYNNEFYLVGASMYSVRSADGLTWNLGGPGFGRVVMRNGNTLVVRDRAVASISSDGVMFQGVSIAASRETPNAGTFGGGLFVSAGNDGEIVTSPDGMMWTVARMSDSPNFDNGPHLQAVAYLGDRFVAVGDLGGCYESTTGQSWAACALKLPPLNFTTLVPTGVAGEAWLGGQKGFVGRVRF